MPVLVIETDTGSLLVKNPASGRLPLNRDALIESTRIEAGRFLPYLAAQARGEDGLLVVWPLTPHEISFRAFARVLPPADGSGKLTVITFLESTGRESVESALREALQARDEFFSVATHELKDPLFSIQLSLQLLRHAAEKQGPLPPYLAHHLDVSGRQADRLSLLIDNLLDVSRIRSGRIQLDTEPLDLAEHVQDVTARFQDLARSSGSALTCETPQQVIGYFDRLKLDQVLSNLLTNALKYGAGQPVVVRLKNEDDSVVLEVDDRGPGITPDDQERIFARFERASGAFKKESLGLGLFIVRAIVQAHGGTVRVHSRLGQGAAFIVTLPRNRIHHKDLTSLGTRPSEGAANP